MNESSVKQRKEEILSALQESIKSNPCDITIKPINGSGDMEIYLKWGNKWKDRSTKQGVVKYDEDITHLRDLFYK